MNYFNQTRYDAFVSVLSQIFNTDPANFVCLLTEILGLQERCDLWNGCITKLDLSIDQFEHLNIEPLALEFIISWNLSNQLYDKVQDALTKSRSIQTGIVILQSITKALETNPIPPEHLKSYFDDLIRCSPPLSSVSLKPLLLFIELVNDHLVSHLDFLFKIVVRLSHEIGVEILRFASSFHRIFF